MVLHNATNKRYKMISQTSVKKLGIAKIKRYLALSTGIPVERMCIVAL